MKKYDFGVSALLIVLSLLLIRSSLTLGAAATGTAMGSGVWPAMLGALLIVLSAVLAVQAALKKGDDEPAPIDFRSAGMKRMYILFGLLLAFVAVLKLLGFYIAVACLIPAVMRLLGEKRLWMDAALTAGMLAFVHLVFVLLLDLKLPGGLLFG